MTRCGGADPVPRHRNVGRMPGEKWGDEIRSRTPPEEGEGVDVRQEEAWGMDSSRTWSLCGRGTMEATFWDHVHEIY